MSSRSINRILVANRAEIAARVFRTCRKLGIETVAVHSDADADLPYVRDADYAVHLPGTSPTDTYLRGDLLVDAARRAGADAIHPGYGFLSESAEFARTVLDAGLTWIGPDPESIDQMGSKILAKELMEKAGVPVLTSIHPEDATPDHLPLLVKASAGGGGRGMRVVRDLAQLPAEVEKAEAEARSAFGDGTVFVETYVERGRHVEVQILGTTKGVVVLGERDCSLQRRHQKVVEEAPAPRLSRTTRKALHEAARTAAGAIGYRGAGTVEFLYAPPIKQGDTERFFFLEMNTRLQVEHPVTEETFGIDLVDLQIAVAEGRSPYAGEDPHGSGHAIEVRLYAEDPARDYQPQSGTLTRFEVPEPRGIRVDAGFETGSEVSTHYDAMLAKVVAYANTREEAARRLADTLARARIHGVTTNRDLLVGILRDPAFLAGEVSTAFLEGDGASRLVADAPRTSTTAAATAAALALAERAREARTVQQGIPVAWRNVVSQPQRTEFDGDLVIEWYGGRDGYHVDGFTVVEARTDRVTLEVDGVRTSYEVAVAATGSDDVFVDSPQGHVALRRVPRFVNPADVMASGSLLAPMPGTVVKVAVEQGAAVAAGDVVLVLEAMKMQHTVTAPTAGTVTEIDVQPGSQVAAGDVLAVVTGEDT